MLSHINEYIVIRHHDREYPEIIVGRSIGDLSFIIKLTSMSRTLKEIARRLQFCSLVGTPHPQRGIILFAKTVHANRIFKGIISNDQERKVRLASLSCHFKL